MGIARRIKLLCYAICKYVGVFAILRRLNSSNVVILCYHGGAIGDQWQFRPKLFMRLENFRNRIDWLLARGYHFVSLDDICRNPLVSMPKLPVVITFDDGWMSTCTQLLPILKDRAICSTLYLSTSIFESGLPVSSVIIGYIVSKRRRNQIAVHALLGGAVRYYNVSIPSELDSLMGEVAEWTLEAKARREDVYDMLNHMALLLDADVADLGLSSRRFEYATAVELGQAREMGCSIELHGHIHRYPVGDVEAFNEDLAACEESICRLGLPMPRHFCYPSGNHDVGAAAILRKRGVLSATTCLPGSISEVSSFNRYYLPRILDGDDVDTLEFEAELCGFRELLRRMAAGLKWQ